MFKKEKKSGKEKTEGGREGTESRYFINIKNHSSNCH